VTVLEPGAFTDKTREPSAPAVAASLGRAHNLWLKTRDIIAFQHPPVSEEWVFGGKNYGWSLRLGHRKRAVLYLTPCRGYFRAGLALGEKATRAALEAKLPAATIALINEAPRYVEGRAVRINVRRASDVRTIAALAAVRMAN
jgi:hypothetical protein